MLDLCNVWFCIGCDYVSTARNFRTYPQAEEYSRTGKMATSGYGRLAKRQRPKPSRELHHDPAAWRRHGAQPTSGRLGAETNTTPAINATGLTHS